MIQIGEIVVSGELFEEHFICHMEKCHGNCCVHGDSGAPLSDAEADELEGALNALRPYLKREGTEALEDQGGWVIDDDGEKVTPLVKGKECAYAVFREGVARCGIEIAYEQGAVPFRKPVSCHLYPIRVNRLRNGVALNYHRWGICEPARILGKREGIPVFRFLKDAIERVYGKGFYRELERSYKEWKTRKS